VGDARRRDTQHRLAAILEPISYLRPFAALRSCIAAEVEHRSTRLELDARLLLRRVLLHLPQLDSQELCDVEIVTSLIDAVARRSAYVPPAPRAHAQTTGIVSISEPMARWAHSSMHYLAQPRAGVHFGLLAPDPHPTWGHLRAVATVSPLDVPQLTPHLPPHTMVLSRLVACADGSKVIMSRFLAQLAKYLQTHSPYRALAAYLDSNIGFTGSVYQASNWVLVATERKHPYLYVDGHYITTREALVAHGSACPERLHATLGPRFRVARQPLDDLQVYLYPFAAHARARYQQCVVTSLEPDPVVVRGNAR
jgi:hypothetical protein